MVKLPIWVMNQNKPAIYDSESATAIEMVAKVYGAMQELIDEYNGFATNVNKKIDEFTSDTNADYDAFKIALRQEFQDFIDVINLKVMDQDKKIDDAVSYMKTNISNTASEIVKVLLENEEVYIKQTYNEETESLNFVLGGEQ